MTPPIVAVIPARAGSSRIASKNTRMLAGRPLIQWTIEAAKQSGVPFDEIVVNTDDPGCRRIAIECGVEAYERSPYLAQDTTSMREVLLDFALNAWPPDHSYLDDVSFMVLFPTYPLRTAAHIRDIYARWVRDCDGGRLGLLGVVDGGLEARAVTLADSPAPTRVAQMHPDIYRTQDSALALTTGPVFCHFACIVPAAHLGSCTPALVTDGGTVAMPLNPWAGRAFETDTEAEWARAEGLARWKA